MVPGQAVWVQGLRSPRADAICVSRVHERGAETLVPALVWITFADDSPRVCSLMNSDGAARSIEDQTERKAGFVAHLDRGSDRRSEHVALLCAVIVPSSGSISPRCASA
jgi:hypothetical protein